jgi:hypothetical protein
MLSQDGNTASGVASNAIIGTENYVDTPLNWISNEIIFFDLRYTFADYQPASRRWYPSFREWNVTTSTCRYDD